MNKEVSLYIHIPFCKQKCLYCDFSSFCGKENLMLDYTKALCKELNTLINYNIKTIFIGGGTPTYLSLDALKIIKKTLDKFNFKEDVEFTVEGNPGTLQREKLQILKEMGVNRLSIGLQTWQNNLLKKLGRIHDREEFLDGFYMARKMGFNNINIDLMFGIPDQKFSDWEETLINIVKLNPEHISCYSLILEEGTPFYNMYKKDELNIPEEDEEREMYDFAIKFLKSNGYNQYEISNFSKHNKECKHNLVYWNTEEYIGIGTSAHSFVNNMRFFNEGSIEKYIYEINKKESAILEKHENNLKDNIEEFMFMGLRKIEGISEIDFKKRFKKDICDVYEDVITKYIKLGLLAKKEHRIFLTKRGIEVSNIIMSDFIL